MLPRFSLEDAIAASDEWGFNCGPAAVAVICGYTPAELRPHLGDFELKRYANPTLMAEILRNIGARVVENRRLDPRVEMQRKSVTGLPRFGIVRIQWEGPWTEDGVPIAARYRHTHWVGSCWDNRANIGIWDVNCLNNGTGWVALDDWISITVPFIIKTCHPRGNGKWHVTHSIKLERGEI
jgi:hypothetical protein